MSKLLKFMVTVAGLGAVGIAFGGIGGFLGGKAAGRGAGFEALGLVVLGLVTGYTVGIVVGIFMLKSLLHQRGSLVLGVVASVIGTAALFLLAEPLRLNSNTNLLFVVFLVVVPAFGAAGFSLKR